MRARQQPHLTTIERIRIMIKCGTIAAVVIAGSAVGTATLVSNPPGVEGIAAGGQAAVEQRISVRGVRSELTTAGTVTPSVGDQPRRGERPDHEPVAVAMAASPGDSIRRGTR
jgi:hypothetical protein